MLEIFSLESTGGPETRHFTERESWNLAGGAPDPATQVVDDGVFLRHDSPEVPILFASPNWYAHWYHLQTDFYTPIVVTLQALGWSRVRFVGVSRRVSVGTAPRMLEIAESLGIHMEFVDGPADVNSEISMPLWRNGKFCVAGKVLFGLRPGWGYNYAQAGADTQLMDGLGEIQQRLRQHIVHYVSGGKEAALTFGEAGRVPNICPAGAAAAPKGTARQMFTQLTSRSNKTIKNDFPVDTVTRPNILQNFLRRATTPPKCLITERAVWLERSDPRSVDEAQLWAAHKEIAATSALLNDVQPINFAKKSWSESQKILQQTTLLMGISGAGFMNQWWLPRGSKIVILDCTGCFFGQFCTINDPHRAHDLHSQFFGHHVLHYMVESNADYSAGAEDTGVAHGFPLPSPHHFWKGAEYKDKNIMWKGGTQLVAVQKIPRRDFVAMGSSYGIVGTGGGSGLCGIAAMLGVEGAFFSKIQPSRKMIPCPQFWKLVV